MPNLLNLPTTPAPPITSSDINSLFPSEMVILDLVAELFISIWNFYIDAIPIAFLNRFTISSSRQPEFSRLKAKINLALCAMSWDIIIGIWRLKRDNARLYRALEEDGAQLIPDIILARSTRSHEDREVSTPDRPRRNRKSPKVDDITKLERRRGASPTPLQTLESSASGSDSSGSSSPTANRSSLPSSSRKRKAPPVQSSKSRQMIYGLDQHIQTGPPQGSESDWFDVSPRRKPSLGEDHEKISRWYSRSPRRSSESDSTTSAESDHLPTPFCLPVTLPLPSNESPTADRHIPEKSVEPVDDHALHYTPIESGRKDNFVAECQKEPTSSLMADVVETATSPFIALGLLIALGMLMIWWRLDPPESAVVVL